MSANNYTRISNGMYTLISGVRAEFETEQDEAIANSQLQINKLKTIKQACLSQMFA